MPGPQLKKLAEKAPASLVKQVNKGFGDISYLPMAQVVQILLHHLDAPFQWAVGLPFDSGDEREPIGMIGTLIVMVDGDQFTVQGVGTGTDVKKAESDALKRCAMKIGLGLELWAQDGYWLDRATGWKDDA